MKRTITTLITILIILAHPFAQNTGWKVKTTSLSGNTLSGGILKKDNSYFCLGGNYLDEFGFNGERLRGQQ